MKRILFIFLTITLLACGNETPTNPAETPVADTIANDTTTILEDTLSVADTTATDTTVVEIPQGPIIHETLTAEQIEKIKRIQLTFSEVYLLSLEETIDNFKRDKDPDGEIAIWMHMAEVFNIFAAENNGEKHFKRRAEAFKLIILRSVKPAEEAIADANIEHLTEEEVTAIMENYKLDAMPTKAGE